MINLLEFKNFLNEAGIPIFNDDDYAESINPEPRKMIKSTEIISEMEKLLKKVEEDEYDAVHVIAEIPRQGKKAPEYVKELVEEEKERRERREYNIYGSRREAIDRPMIPDPTPAKITFPYKLEDEINIDKRPKGPNGEPLKPEPLPDINIFIDSEFKIDRIEKDKDGNEYMVGYPLSFLNKIKRNPKLKEKYFANIYPNDVIDITYFIAY